MKNAQTQAAGSEQAEAVACRRRYSWDTVRRVMPRCALISLLYLMSACADSGTRLTGCESIQCHDGNDCTVDVCVEPSQLCDFLPVSDGASCRSGICVAGACVPACVDSVCPCTEAGIRAAIVEGGGPFRFDCEGPTRVETEAEIFIDNDVILDGDGNLTVDGGLRHRVFSVGRVTATLLGITVTRGFVVDTHGGGIANLEGDLTLERCTITRNYADTSRFGLIVGGGGIFNVARLNIIDSTVSNNGADYGFGGGILNGDFRDLLPSGEPSPGDLTIINSTISQNVSEPLGGGIVTAAGPVSVRFSTVTKNSGGAVATLYSGSDARFAISTSIIDGECSAEVHSDGYNIESPGDTCGLDQRTDQVNVELLWLETELGDDGGPTKTHALLSASVAIDVIPAEACVDADGTPLTTDQRGKTRPETGGTLCDVGAFEVQP